MDGKIQFYDIVEGKNVKHIDTKTQLNSISFCPDGHTIAVGTLRGRIFVYDLKDTKKTKIELKGQEGTKINCMQFSRLVKSSKTSTNQSKVSSTN
mmetsp:Transcript_8160/g.7589  ORF Transcript_8160/g.7589 Transcript_8160/m.7589 type:complete len:95 (-) Transcript_8160:865-1149(-)